jgi:hypothetical protein
MGRGERSGRIGWLLRRQPGRRHHSRGLHAERRSTSRQPEDSDRTRGPSRDVAYTAPRSGRGVATGRHGSGDGPLATNATLEADVTYMDVNSHVGTVRVGASDSATVASVRTETFSQNAPHTVKSSVSEVSNDARIQAGEHLRWVGLVGPIVEEKRNCTAGPGAYEWLAKTANGQSIEAEFLLSAGHCFAVDDHVKESVYPRGTDNFNWIGKVTRTAYRGMNTTKRTRRAFRAAFLDSHRRSFVADRVNFRCHTWTEGRRANAMSTPSVCAVPPSSLR